MVVHRVEGNAAATPAAVSPSGSQSRTERLKDLEELTMPAPPGRSEELKSHTAVTESERKAFAETLARADTITGREENHIRLSEELREQSGWFGKFIAH